MKEKLRSFMTGRYGSDQLNRLILIIVMAFLVVDLFVRKNVLLLPGLFLLGVCYFRMFSRNYTARYSENQKYLEIKGKVVGRFKKEKYLMSQRKDYHIYTCPSCQQKIRVPRGKGQICVTCPKCHAEFQKKS
jgi:ribosomal protein L37AE/L43A